MKGKKMLFNFRHCLQMLGCIFILSSCADTKRALGIDKSIPDEFSVLRRAPLVIPPDFNLKPPAPGSVRPQEGSSRDRAMNALMGRNRIQSYGQRGFSLGEVELLYSAGADAIIPDIRSIIDRETSAFAKEPDKFTNRLIFWRENIQLGTPIDPLKEKKRLEDNKESGKSPNEGPIPVISKGGSSMLGIF